MTDLPLTLESSYKPAGDQPQAIDALTKGILKGEKDQTLLGVTGSGKTFTMAHVIQNCQKPSLVLAPNKILAAQLYNEMKYFFPSNAVEYFVSYYDYYQPEAYVPRTDTYIEKTASINEQIDRMRHSATRSLLERRDVVVVASVSCIYGIGGVNTYSEMVIPLEVGQDIDTQSLARQLVQLQYKRQDIAFQRGCFRIRGDTVEIFPSHFEDRSWKISFFGSTIESIHEVDALTGARFNSLSKVSVYANSHYVTPGATLDAAVKEIQFDLEKRLRELRDQEKLLEAQRLDQRVRYDIESIVSTGTCAGIENYSRYLTGRKPGDPPPTLFEYLPTDALLFVDESHVSIPQLRGMYAGDQARKRTLSEFGFRLPSCLDNRPLKFEEWDLLRPQTIYVSATPGPYELERTKGLYVEQVIRPTGIVDPQCIVRPCDQQVDDLMHECHKVIAEGKRILVTTLTKKMAEALTDYFNENKLRVRYLHSDIDTLERIEIIRQLRLGDFDVLVGINLLREGLDIPECGLMAILDADKEGYLRSKTSLIQTIGRAARHHEGRVVLYADRMTESLKGALEETARRRAKQLAYNEEHNISPTTVFRKIELIEREAPQETQSSKRRQTKQPSKPLTKAEIEKQMFAAAKELNFEEAARLRDLLKDFEAKELGL